MATVTSTNNTTNTASSAASTTATNPNAQLKSQDFMKLLLTELQYQDPTQPMDTQQMLTQTSQLATLESQNATKAAMEAMTKAFGSSASYALAAAIGKMANTGNSTISISGGTGASFSVYLPKDVKGGFINIKNGDGSVVKSIDITGNKSGVTNFDWNGVDNFGQAAADGTYTIEANYTAADGSSVIAKKGSYPIDGIKFDSNGGEPQLSVGGQYLPFSKISEISA